MSTEPNADAPTPSEAELYLVDVIRCTPGQASGYAVSRETSVRLIRQHVATATRELKEHNTALAAALATRTRQRDELVCDLAKLDDGERLRQFDHDTQHLPLNSNDPAA